MLLYWGYNAWCWGQRTRRSDGDWKEIPQAGELRMCGKTGTMLGSGIDHILCAGHSARCLLSFLI